MIRIYHMSLDNSIIFHYVITNKAKLEFRLRKDLVRTEISISMMKKLLKNLPFEEI